MTKKTHQISLLYTIIQSNLCSIQIHNKQKTQKNPEKNKIINQYIFNKKKKQEQDEIFFKKKRVFVLKKKWVLTILKD